MLDKFELKRKGLEETYAVALFYQGFLLFSEVLAKIFFLTNNIEKDIFSYATIAETAGLLLLIFIAVIFAKKGEITAGLLAPVIGIIEILINDKLGIVLGVVLILESIVYIVKYIKR